MLKDKRREHTPFSSRLRSINEDLEPSTMPCNKQKNKEQKTTRSMKRELTTSLKVYNNAVSCFTLASIVIFCKKSCID